jgi:hypothetical protein
VKMQDAVLFAKMAQYAVMAFVILIALDQIRVGGDIVRESFLVILAGVVFALALAFGLAGKDWAKAQIERWWPRQVMRPPQGPITPSTPSTPVAPGTPIAPVTPTTPAVTQAPPRYDDRPPR